MTSGTVVCVCVCGAFFVGVSALEGWSATREAAAVAAPTFGSFGGDGNFGISYVYCMEIRIHGESIIMRRDSAKCPTCRYDRGTSRFSMTTPTWGTAKLLDCWLINAAVVFFFFTGHPNESAKNFSCLSGCCFLLVQLSFGFDFDVMVFIRNAKLTFTNRKTAGTK